MFAGQALQAGAVRVPTGLPRIYCAEGDSITQAGQSYVVQFAPNANAGTTIRNLSIGGSSLGTMAARQAAVDALLPAPRVGRFVCSALIGANDLGAYTPAAYAAELATYCDNRRAAGWQMVVCTVLPSNAWDSSIGGPAFESIRQALNAILRTWPGVHCSAVADFAQTAVGLPGAQNNLTYYLDGLHPTPAAHTILEPVMRAIVNSL